VTDRRALTIALLLVVVLMAAEIVAGMVGHSLALLADAGHLLTDAAALGFALVASAMAARPAAGRWSFG
jgi:cobalt-zinc-cadmium efflux system protein